MAQVAGHRALSLEGLAMVETIKRKARGTVQFVRDSDAKLLAALNIALSWLVVLPLSFVHEAAHLLVAFLLRAPLVLDREQFTVMEYVPEQNRMKTFHMTFYPVRFEDRPVRYILVALAPALVGAAAVVGYPFWVKHVLETWFVPLPAHYPEMWAVLATAFFTVLTLIFAAIVSSVLVPSPEDIKTARTAIKVIRHRRRAHRKHAARLDEINELLHEIEEKKAEPAEPKQNNFNKN